MTPPAAGGVQPESGDRPRLRASLALAAGALTLALGLAAPAARAAGGAGPLPPLHATRGEAPAIVDSRGRQVLLRGTNVNQLNDYFRTDPELPTTVRLRERDFARIARFGFNSVRLTVNWSRLQPRPGEFNRSYLHRIRRAVGWAAERRIYVVVDMHQDAWGKAIATPPGEACPPGLEPALGWDGAPEWATLTDGLSTCRAELREVSPAVAQAFTSFYADRERIQSGLIRTWARVARALSNESAVAGYDLLNEPHPGFLPGVTAMTELADYYAAAIEAIREAERRRGGFHHIVFFEPSVEWSGVGGSTTPPPGFSDDPNLVFAPHLYAESITADRALGISAVSIERGFELAAAAARAYGTTFWSGEWGWFGEPGENADELERYARQEDRHLVGGAWWVWKQACGDPHQFPGPGGESFGISPSLNRFACPSGESLGVPRAFRRVLSRAYPLAAPGRLESLRSDSSTGSLALAGRVERPACGLRVRFPSRGGRPELEGSGVDRLELRRVPGGWVTTACVDRSYELRGSPALSTR
jgi:endoglycosylceramidase